MTPFDLEALERRIKQAQDRDERQEIATGPVRRAPAVDASQTTTVQDVWTIRTEKRMKNLIASC